MKTKSGFSLVELISSVAVVATLSLVSYPAIESMKGEAVKRAEVREMVSSLMKAKVEAIKQNRFVVVQFSDSGYTAFVDDGANGGRAKDGIRQSGEREVAHHQNIAGLTLSTNFPADRMRFKGRVGIRGGTVIFASAEKPFAKVVLSLTGRVRVEKL